MHRLALKGLNDTDTARLLETTMARVPEAELAERVQAQTAGNPLFVAEVGRLLASPAPRRSSCRPTADSRSPTECGKRSTAGSSARATLAGSS